VGVQAEHVDPTVSMAAKRNALGWAGCGTTALGALLTVAALSLPWSMWKLEKDGLAASLTFSPFVAAYEVSVPGASERANESLPKDAPQAGAMAACGTFVIVAVLPTVLGLLLYFCASCVQSTVGGCAADATGSQGLKDMNSRYFVGAVCALVAAVGLVKATTGWAAVQSSYSNKDLCGFFGQQLSVEVIAQFICPLIPAGHPLKTAAGASVATVALVLAILTLLFEAARDGVAVYVLRRLPSGGGGGEKGYYAPAP
jgi:hypothetical protein